MAKKKTILDLYKMKESGEKAVWITAYDSCFASYAEKAGMDMILVGDSMGMMVYGYQGTVPVTMDMSINHCQAVRRGAPNTYIIGDMPFGSYHESSADAVHNAVRFLKEADVDAIKLEGGVSVADKVKAIVQAGIVVFGHVGLTPQSSAAMGGFKAQGRTVESARAVVEDAIAVYKAGAKVVLLEGVPEEVCSFVHKILPVPVYGIGAGADCDGQVMVINDILGMFEDFTPKFARKYADVAGIAVQGIAEYIKETKAGVFPGPDNKYKVHGEPAEFERLFAELEMEFGK
ncbi:MAG TPA: 3-methyl-2-oxobutanoate hydroxymethyltransferase [Clostridiaceae bacterium]